MSTTSIEPNASSPPGSTNVIATEPVPVAEAEIVEGTLFPFDAVPAGPGEIVQVIAQPPEGSTILGLDLSEEFFSVVKVLFGSSQLSLAECRGRQIPKGLFFVIVLAKNITEVPQVARGAWYLSGVPAAAVQAQAKAAAARIDPGLPSRAGDKPKPVFLGEGLGATQHPSNMPAIHTAAPVFAVGVPAQTSRSVTPGQNEVVVLLHRSEVERVIAWLTGKDPVSEHEKPGILRQLQSALTR